jgi:ATP-dependent Clp protease adaptor protein ClpS
MGDREQDERREGGVGLQEREEKKTQKPRKYKVLLHNDDFTPIDFVAVLVQTVFRKTIDESMQITLQVHEKGMAVAGVYTHEIAETKVAQVHVLARNNQHPLMCSMEPED